MKAKVAVKQLRSKLPLRMKAYDAADASRARPQAMKTKAAMKAMEAKAL